MRLLVLLVASSLPVWGQNTTGTILGTVSDSTGSVIAGARVMLTNEGTGISAETTSNASGDYQFPNLPPASYMVQAQSDGFRKAQVRKITLPLNATQRQDVKLEPGKLEQSVTVTAEAPVVTSETSSIAAVVDQHMVQNLPLDGRTLDAIVQITPGLTSDSASNPRLGEIGRAHV